MPEKIPVFALVHPWKPDVDHFSLYPEVFAVHVPTRKVLGAPVPKKKSRNC